MLKTILVSGLLCGWLYWTAQWLIQLERSYENLVFSSAAPMQEVHRFSELQTIEFDSQGKPKTELRSPSVTYEPETEKSLLLMPQIKLFRSDASAITLAGDRATVEHTDQRMILQDHVKLTTNADQPGAAQLETSLLVVHLKDEWASTEKPVTITKNNITMDAVGMELDFSQQQIKLLSSVRGRHAN